jgi:hypothetical protein
LASIERYLQAFCRVVLLTQRQWSEEDIALVLACSIPLVAEYRRLAETEIVSPAARRRLQQILHTVEAAAPQEKKGRRA